VLLSYVSLTCLGGKQLLITNLGRWFTGGNHYWLQFNKRDIWDFFIFSSGVGIRGYYGMIFSPGGGLDRELLFNI
jgi:hypothetical protein